MADKIAELEQQVAQLMTSYETSMNKLFERERMLEMHYENSERFLHDQLEKINSLMSELRDLMTEAGAARLRFSNDMQLQQLKKLSDETKQFMTDSCAKFEKTSTLTVKNVNEALTSFKVDEFKQYIDKNYEEVKVTSSSAVEKISDILKWFQWKNLSLALALSIVASVVIGLYINDEWPWEIHEKVVKERAAGQALMNAWPHLNQNDQQYLENKILNLSKENNQ